MASTTPSTDPTHAGGGDDRAAVVDALRLAGREASNAAVMFHAALAARVGLGPVEEKTLDLLQRHGPLTPGALAGLTGLAPPSVTGLLDRLQSRGFLDRIPDPDDRRRRLVRLRPSRVTAIADLFDDLTRGLDEFYAGFTTEELALVGRFLSGSSAVQRAATRRLSQRAPAGDGDG